MKTQKKSKIMRILFCFSPILAPIAGLILAVMMGLLLRGVNFYRYESAKELIKNGEYEKAIVKLEKLGYFEDSEKLKLDAEREVLFAQAVKTFKSQDYEDALNQFENIINASTSDDEIKIESEKKAIEIRAMLAGTCFENGDFEDARRMYEEIIRLYENSKNESIEQMLKDSKKELNESIYILAKNFFDNQDYDNASSLFGEIRDYSDSDVYLARIIALKEGAEKVKVYNKARSLMNDEKYEEAIEWFSDIITYGDSEAKIAECKKFLRMKNLNHTIAAGVKNSYAITNDNKVIAVGSKDFHQCEVDNDDWKSIVSVDCYGTLVIGLKPFNIDDESTFNNVVVAGTYNNGTTVDVKEWKKIIDVTAGEQFVAALDEDKHVMADGLRAGNWNLSGWTDIVDIDAGWDFLVGLTSNHKLVFEGPGSEFFKSQYHETDWKDVIAISAGGGGNAQGKNRDNGHGHVVGLKKDGTIIAIGDDNHAQCSEAINDWENVVRISTGDWYTVGVTENGGVLVTGENFPGSYYIGREYTKEDMKAWTDIVEIVAGFGQTLCLKRDGTIIEFGFDNISDTNELYKTRNWTNLRMPEHLD